MHNLYEEIFLMVRVHDMKGIPVYYYVSIFECIRYKNDACIPLQYMSHEECSCILDISIQEVYVN